MNFVLIVWLNIYNKRYAYLIVRRQSMARIFSRPQIFSIKLNVLVQ